MCCQGRHGLQPVRPGAGEGSGARGGRRVEPGSQDHHGLWRRRPDPPASHAAHCRPSETVHLEGTRVTSPHISFIQARGVTVLTCRVSGERMGGGGTDRGVMPRPLNHRLQWA